MALDETEAVVLVDWVKEMHARYPPQDVHRVGVLRQLLITVLCKECDAVGSMERMWPCETASMVYTDIEVATHPPTHPPDRRRRRREVSMKEWIVGCCRSACRRAAGRETR
jgi:hypothetical protein